MKTFFYTLFLPGLLLLLAGPPAAFARGAARESNLRSRRPVPRPGQRDPGDLYYVLDVEAITGDGTCYGVQYDGADWWVTGSGNMLSPKLYRIDYNGVLLQVFDQGTTGWGWRDMAFDGSYLYAGENASIVQIDRATGMKTGFEIPAPLSPPRALAYDSGTDTFWTAGFSSPLYELDRSGVVLRTVQNPGLSIRGMAMDESDPRNPILWIWSADGPGSCRATPFDPGTGGFPGKSWDGDASLGAAAGCCILDDPASGWAFAGMQLGATDAVGVYDYTPDPEPKCDIKCNGGDAGVVILSGDTVTLTIAVEARTWAGRFVDIWCIAETPFGFFCHDGTSWRRGLGHAYYTGPLADMKDTVLDNPLPAGKYKAHLGIDAVPDGRLTLSAVAAHDAVDFEVKSGE